METKLNDYFKIVKEQSNALRSNIIRIIKDSDLSLEERWEWYKEFSYLLPIETFYLHPIEELENDELTLIDDFYCSKYALMKGIDFIEVCEDMEKDINIDSAKKFFCDKAIMGFINNW